MSLLSLETFLEWPWRVDYLSSYASAINLDAANEKLGMMIRCPYNITVDKLVLSFGSVTQNPVNGLKVSFQGVALVGGKASVPDGNISHYRVITTGEIVGSSSIETGLITDDGTDTGAKKTLSIGEVIAIVVEYNNFVAGDNLQLRMRQGFGYPMKSSWVHQYLTDWGNMLSSFIPNVLFKDSSNNYYPSSTYCGVGSWSHAQSQAINVNSDPDECGIKFVSSYTCKLVGIHINWAMRTTDFDMVLYDNNDTVLATKRLEYDTGEGIQDPGNAFEYFYMWDTPIEISEGSTYRVTFKALVGSPNCIFYYCNYTSVNYLIPTIEWTQRTNEGSWTDNNARVPTLALVFSEIASGGLSGHRGMNGGLIA
jgi:hypothetical protein